MKYLKNLNTGNIISAEQFGELFSSTKWIECTQEEIDNFELNSEKEKYIISRKNYLSITDWCYLRQIETSEEIPTEILDKRILARNEINLIEQCTTLEQLEEYNNF